MAVSPVETGWQGFARGREIKDWRVWPFLAGGCALLSEGVQQGAHPKGEAVMNKLSIVKLSLIAAVLALTSMPSTLHAQSSSDLARVEVPFAFEVGSTHFAPGVYNIGTLYGSKVLYVRGTNHCAFASMQYDANGKTIADGKVVFQRVGSRSFLAEVWSAGTTEHLVTYKSKAEKEALRELAANHSTIQGTEIILAQATK
jgi:hypothetical protein